MKHLLAAATIALLASGAALAHEDDYDKKQKRDVVIDHDLSGFTAIDISGVYELKVTQGDRFSVQTRSTKKEADRMEIRVRNNTLYLETDNEKGSRGWGGSNNNGVEVIITMPQLEELDVAGIVSGEVSAFSGGDVDIDVSGISSVSLRGTCDTLTVDLAGMGELDARELKCRHVEADMGGMGEMSVYASESIEADAEGMGSIEVYGDPKTRDTDDTFLAKVRFR